MPDTLEAEKRQTTEGEEGSKEENTEGIRGKIARHFDGFFEFIFSTRPAGRVTFVNPVTIELERLSATKRQKMARRSIVPHTASRRSGTRG